MEYVAPVDAADPDDPYVSGDPGGGVEGTAVPAEAIEHPMREIVNVIEEAGLTPDGEDLTQLHAAIAALIAASVSVSSRALLTHDLASGTDGGSTTTGSWQTRPLNTEEQDADGIVALSSNQFVLGAGTYVISAYSAFHSENESSVAPRTRLRNVTDGATAALSLGVMMNATSSVGFGVISIIPRTRLVLAAEKTFELQYSTNVAQATTGLGWASSSGEVERFAAVNIEKVA